MHHKFVVIDFDKPTARVYLGSYNFSIPADKKNGENLLVIRDRRIAVSYTVEALRIFDHYHFRVTQQEAKKAKKTLELAKPPRRAGEKPWFPEDYTIRVRSGIESCSPSAARVAVSSRAAAMPVAAQRLRVLSGASSAARSPSAYWMPASRCWSIWGFENTSGPCPRPL